MKELIDYLERKIELCTEMNMPLERWAFFDCLKEARSIQLLQTAVSKSVCSMQGNGFCPYEKENGKCINESDCVNKQTAY